VRMQSFVDEAPDVLALWNQTHDWSQREKVFGAATGYVRES
jgi:glyoxylase I family protein